MSTVTIQLPDSVMRLLQQCVESHGLTIDQIVNSALRAQLSALMDGHFVEEAKRRQVSREEFLGFLALSPDVEPEEYDRLPARSASK